MPITFAQKRKLTQKIDQLVKQGDKLDVLASQEFLKILKDTQSRLVREIKLADDWELANLVRIRTRLDRIIDTFPERMLPSVDNLSGQAWDLGRSMVDTPLDTMKVAIGLPEIPTATLLAMRGTTDELIAGLTSEMRTKVRTAISQALLGELTPYRAGQKIQAEIGGIRNRGEKIIRTEVGGIQSVASQLRLEQAKQYVPDLKKRWLTVVDVRTRPSHTAINGQVKGIEEPFDLVNDRTGEIEHPQEPRDPILSAENRVNCRCVHLPFKEDWI